jgi:SPP1 family predicted phage head-tail adaptor
MTKCCDITAGILKTSIEIQKQDRTSDGSGGYISTWSARAQTPKRAKVEFKNGREIWNGERIEATSSFKMTMRFSAAVTESDRIIVKGRAHNIRSINNIEMQDRWMIIQCDLGVAV